MPAFEGLFVAGIGGSYPLGHRRGGRGRAGGGAGSRLTRRLGGGRGGRSRGWDRAVTARTLCLLISKAASAASAAFAAARQNTPSSRRSPPLGRCQQLETKMFPPSACNHAVALILHTKIAFSSST